MIFRRVSLCRWAGEAFTEGPFALQPISATGRAAALVQLGDPNYRGLVGPYLPTMDAALVQSGSGRCIVAWEDVPSYGGLLVAQRYDQNGNPLWNNGNPIIASSALVAVAIEGGWFSFNPAFVVEQDGNDGAIMAWFSRDSRYSYPQTNYPIQIQRINASGNALWGSDGISLGTRGFSYPVWPWIQLVPDGSGGAFMIICETGNNCVVYTIRANGTVSGTPATVISMFPFPLERSAKTPPCRHRW